MNEYQETYEKEIKPDGPYVLLPEKMALDRSFHADSGSAGRWV